MSVLTSCPWEITKEVKTCSVVLCLRTVRASLMKKGKRGERQGQRGILIRILISPQTTTTLKI